jgi:hypothetical protein
MSLSRALALALFISALVMLTDGSALADASNAKDDPRLGASAGISIGYGHEFVQGIQGLDLGFGASGGYTFVPHLYLGGSFVAHLGAAERAHATGYTYDNRRSEYALSAEAGYDFLALQRWVIRPVLTGGFFVDNNRTSVGQAALSSHNLYGFLGFGATTFVRIERFRVGIDLRVPVFPSAFVSRLMLTGCLLLGMYF